MDLSTELAGHLARHAAMWRISNDVWDRWEDLLGRIGIRAEVGGDRVSRLTSDEQRTMLTLWCIAHSPLFVGGDLPSSPPETIALLTNPDVLAVHAADAPAAEVLREGDLVVWTMHQAEQTVAAEFWLGDTAQPVSLPLSTLGATGAVGARDLWTGDEVSIREDGLHLVLPPRGAYLLEVTSP